MNDAAPELLDDVTIRVHGSADRSAIIYLPGLHGDWTLVSSFRAALGRQVRFVEITYPRNLHWQLDDYARAVRGALQREQIANGWLLGESFGSQVVWKMLELAGHGASGFRCEGIILAGGFIRHPVMAGVHCFHALHRAMPMWLFRAFLKLYEAYARFRHCRAPETRAGVAEFLARRTARDLAAIGSRYPLIASNDLRPVARLVTVPVYQLTGCIDPIVPWPLVRNWLRRHCPGYRETCVLFAADHNVLGTAPHQSAERVLEWMAWERGHDAG